MVAISVDFHLKTVCSPPLAVCMLHVDVMCAHVETNNNVLQHMIGLCTRLSDAKVITV